MKKIALASAFLSAFLFTTHAVQGKSAEVDVHDTEDKLESFNRAMFKFNDVLDKNVLIPLAKGYRKTTTKDMRTAVNASLDNLKEPITSISYLLQGEPDKSVISVGRFAVNSTLGLAGLFDVATGWGWKLDKTNMDKTFAKWCIPDGPYIVLPFMGPTTPRAFVGRSIDNFADPIYWATSDHEDGTLGYIGYLAVQAIAFREATIELTDDLERTSVDYYTTMRSAYLQNRSKYGCNKNNTETYDFDFGYNESEDLN